MIIEKLKISEYTLNY